MPAAILFISLLAAVLPLQRPHPHALVIDFPVGNALATRFEEWPADLPIHRVEVTAQNEILWDGELLNSNELVAKAEAAAGRVPRPGLVFAPHGNAGYDLSAQVLNLLRRAGATASRFCLGDLSQYRQFGRSRPAHPKPAPLLFLTIFPDSAPFEPGLPLTPAQCDSGA